MKGILLIICTLMTSPCKCVAFLQSTNNIEPRQAAVNSKSYHPSLLKVASTRTSSIVSSPGINTKEASNELISLLIKRRRGRINNNDEERISSLVNTLTSARVQFDPSSCLDGPLFVSNVVAGPPPLWKRFGIKNGASNSGERNDIGNIQGQQYVYLDDEKSVVNYAEIFGKAFHVRAYGTYERDEEDNDETRSGKRQEDNSLLLGNVLEIFGGGKSASRKASNMIQCPADFTVTVTKGSFFVLGRRFDIPIAGTGYLRVLYADENLRIFVSPKSTTDDRWEKAGLKVAQVNINCFLGGDGEFEDLCAAS